MLVTRRRLESQRGQAMIVLIFAFIALMGFAALALDGGHDYLTRRDVQNAADSSALAAGKLLAATGQRLTVPPSSSNDAAVEAANEFAANNGFSTTRNTTCDSSSGSPATSFTTTWFDTAGLGCNATSGFGNKVTVSVPPVVTNGVSVPQDCAGNYRYNCIQITVTHVVRSFLAGVIGFPTTNVAATSVVFGQPPSSGFATPPAIAANLYEPASGFNTANAPSRGTNLSCSGGNCPTFWVTNGTKPTFEGVDGGNIAGNVDTVALQSNGTMMIQGQTLICDTYNSTVGGTPSACTNSTPGPLGFALNTTSTPASKLYCSQLHGASSPAGCTTTAGGGAHLDVLTSNETSYTTSTWAAQSPVVPTTDCGTLVLNGDSVLNAEPVPACKPPSSEPYSILPGKYNAIVINHGSYEFASGLFYIYGTAPVNTNAGSCTGTGYTANGIDHCREGASDFDLCTANNGNGSPTSCPNLTAGVWIGHGGGGFTAATTGTSATCTGGTAGTDGGGGDNTVVTGSGVSFYFAANSNTTANAFVSTNEVSEIDLNSPGIGALSAVNDMPMLIDNENSGFVHLDAAPISGGTTGVNGFAGIVYQNPLASAGGVEIDPSLAGGTVGALQGQVLAYSLTFFGGGTGIGVDFSNGYGASSAPNIGTSGRNESTVISTPSPSLTGAATGFETFTLHYADEWALDAYDVYIKVDGGSPVFFSQGIWDSAPAPNSTLPPPSNVPGDASPANPDYAAAQNGAVSGGNGAYTTKLDPTTGIYDDWTFTYADHSTMEVSGQWIWGHQKDLPGAVSGNNNATIKYTFPVPFGTTVAIQIFMTDGDHCGDYATANYTFNNIGQPAGGQQSAGAVLIEE
jgi:Flp pilus assembly protein TadG